MTILPHFKCCFFLVNWQFTQKCLLTEIDNDFFLSRNFLFIRIACSSFHSFVLHRSRLHSTKFVLLFPFVDAIVRTIDESFQSMTHNTKRFSFLQYNFGSWQTCPLSGGVFCLFVIAVAAQFLGSKYKRNYRLARSSFESILDVFRTKCELCFRVAYFSSALLEFAI